MKYYLDTNIIIYAMKNEYPNIKNHFLKVPSSSIVIPNIVLAEIEYGARKSKNYKKTIDIYNQFTNTFEMAEFSRKAVKEYGNIRKDLEKQGKIIGPNDLIIAAIVKSEDGILVTHNTNEFSKVKGLNIEDWTI